jgi:hypothetical protein
MKLVFALLLTSFPRKRESICFYGKVKMDSRFRGNDDGVGSGR